MRPALALTTAVLALAGCAGLGVTEKSGSIGDELTAKGLKVTVKRLDRHVPVPESDLSGLSSPRAGHRLVGARVRVCSDHGQAIGTYDFGVESSAGEARVKFPALNYDDRFESVRDGCEAGWLVLEIPRDSNVTTVTFRFEDTGSNQPGDNSDVDARFSWKVSAED
ncbi:MAG TPA: hypothetical protein VJT75_08790 [Thermoleophilaceae bacterium]|nr:hypothetical protein [Thermoleophilaceae bacterium]